MIVSNFEALKPPQSLILPPEPPLEGPSALKYHACQQNQASWNTEPSQPSQDSHGEMGGGAVQTPTSHAPGVRMTVVQLTPSNKQIFENSRPTAPSGHYVGAHSITCEWFLVACYRKPVRQGCCLARLVWATAATGDLGVQG